MCKCKCRKSKGCCVLRILGKILKIALIAYAVLFGIFFFDLDSKLFYRIIPVLNKYHYDVMPHRDFTKTAGMRKSVE